MNVVLTFHPQLYVLLKVFPFGPEPFPHDTGLGYTVGSSRVAEWDHSSILHIVCIWSEVCFGIHPRIKIENWTSGHWKQYNYYYVQSISIVMGYGRMMDFVWGPSGDSDDPVTYHRIPRFIECHYHSTNGAKAQYICTSRWGSFCRVDVAFEKGLPISSQFRSFFKWIFNGIGILSLFFTSMTFFVNKCMTLTIKMKNTCHHLLLTHRINVFFLISHINPVLPHRRYSHVFGIVIFNGSSTREDGHHLSPSCLSIYPSFTNIIENGRWWP